MINNAELFFKIIITTGTFFWHTTGTHYHCLRKNR